MDPFAGSDQPTRIRLALGEPLRIFVYGIMRLELPDDACRRALTYAYRQAVERAAAQGMETMITWHTLGVWTEEGKERIGFFSRALDCQRAATAQKRPATPNERRSDLHTRAECLFEIGRIHAHEGEPAVARDFFHRALPLARKADALRSRCTPSITFDDRLEGRILELLLQLPDEAADGPGEPDGTVTGD